MPFAVRIDYIHHVYCATCPVTGGAEMFAAPYRLFAALVDAHKSGDTDDRDIAAERAALLWLEGCEPPSFRVGNVHFPPKGGVRFAAATMVGRDKMEYLPDFRLKHVAEWPECFPEGPTYVVYEEDAGVHRRALEALCRRVVWLGRSESLVEVCVVDAWPVPDLAPGGAHVVRLPYKGLLSDLELAWEREIRHNSWRTVGYGAPASAVDGEDVVKQSALGIMEVYRLSSDRVVLASTWDSLLRSLRGEFLRRVAAGIGQDGSTPLPSVLSGHEPDGSPALSPHISFLPLIEAGHAYASGRVVGVAVALPVGVGHGDPAYRLMIDALDAMERFAWTDIRCEVGLKRLPPNMRPPGASLDFRRLRGYGGAKEWATVLPMVFDGFPKKRATPEGVLKQWKTLVRKALERGGLKAEIEMEVGDAAQEMALSALDGGPPLRVSIDIVNCSPLHGAVDARLLRPDTRDRQGRERGLAHVVLRFDRPVVGPIVIGAMRHKGYGLCLPLAPDDRAVVNGKEVADAA